MKLVLHIGAHKTATTTIQQVYDKNRARLRKAGVWYPAYSELFPMMRNHYAHLDVAKALMGESKKLTPEQVEVFFARLHNNARSMKGVDSVLISAEPFYRGRLPGEGQLPERRRGYVAQLRELIPFDDVEVVLVLRRQDDYLESLYNEHVKVTRYAEDIWSFLKDYRSRFEYKAQIELWTEFFPAIKIFTFEELVADRNPARDFLTAVFGPRDVELEAVGQESNVSLPVGLVEFKRRLNRTLLSRPELSRVVDVLQTMAKARAGEKSSRASRLSAQDRKNILADFEEDNLWVNRTYFGDRPEGLFPAQIKERPSAPELDADAAVEVAAHVIHQLGMAV